MGLLQKIFGTKSAALETKSGSCSASAPAAFQHEIGVGLARIGKCPVTEAQRVELVENHPVAFACVRKIAWSTASVPWMIANTSGQQDPNDPLVRLLNKPNPRQSRWDFYQLVAASLAVTGNAYVLKIDSAIEPIRGKPRPPSALYFLRPDRIKPRLDYTNNTVIGYDYAGVGTGASFFEPNQVCHIKHSWISEDHIGISLMKPAFEPVSLYAGLSKLARKILENAGGLPGMLVFSNAKSPMSEAQRTDMQTMLNRFKLDGDKFGDILLADVGTGDMKFVPLAGDISKLSPKETKADAAREIYAMFGVPPILISSGEGATFSNMEEANRSFWLDTVVPGYLTPISDAFSAWFGLDIKPDLSEVPALSALRSSLVTTLAAASWLTINEKREAMGYKAVAMGNRVMSAMGQIPLDTQIATQDASAVEMHEPKLLEGILAADAAATELANNQKVN